MKKDFDIWNIKKKAINSGKILRQCHDGEIWMISMGVNIGKEIDGKGDIFARPVLVLNRCNKETFIGVALTRTERRSKWYIPITIDGKQGSINISQIRLLDQHRLLRKIEKLGDNDFKMIKAEIREIFS